MTKHIFKSKRLWTGIIALITSISMVCVGEKTLSDPQFVSEIFMTVWSVVQTVIAITSNSTLELGGSKLN